ncbi:MAG: DUF368 domain-containing protein [Candidatus Margulisbacteria bacterium]|nr:DUF368 domain-containing protein [Candidatus Margulisiibacteriota bacterium]
METWLNFYSTFKLLLKGILIGMTAVIPGINFSAMSVITGTYDKLILLITHPTHKKPWPFLIFLITGILFGVFYISKITDTLLTQHPQPCYFLMIGLVLGTLPGLYKSKREMKFSITKCLALLATLAIILGLNLFPGAADVSTSEQFNPASTSNIAYLFISGLVTSASLLLPGTNGSFMLLMLGSYHIIAGSLMSWNISVLLPSAFGMIIGLLLIFKLLDWGIRKFRGHTHYALLGLVIGSIPKLWPGVNLDLTTLLSIAIGILGIGIGYQLQEH